MGVTAADEKYPIRKPTRLKEWDYSQNGAYFLTICTKNKEKTLCDIVGGGALDAPQQVLSDCGKTAEKYIISTNNIPRVTVDKYVIMPNHIHMIVFLEGPNGPSRAPAPTNALIPHVVSTLKRFVNREIGAPVFQRSFHDHIIRSEKDYQRIWNYIDTNPAKWGDDCFFVP